MWTKIKREGKFAGIGYDENERKGVTWRVFRITNPSIILAGIDLVTFGLTKAAMASSLVRNILPKTLVKASEIINKITTGASAVGTIRTENEKIKK